MEEINNTEEVKHQTDKFRDELKEHGIVTEYVAAAELWFVMKTPLHNVYRFVSSLKEQLQQAQEEVEELRLYKHSCNESIAHLDRENKSLQEENERLKLQSGDQDYIVTYLHSEVQRLREALTEIRKLIYRKDEETGGWLCDPMYTDFGSVLTAIDLALQSK